MHAICAHVPNEESKAVNTIAMIALGVIVFIVVPGLFMLEILCCMYLEHRRDRLAAEVLGKIEQAGQARNLVCSGKES